MTPAQETAIANHCRLAAECVNPMFRHLLKNGFSLNLTVNSGYE